MDLLAIEDLGMRRLPPTAAEDLLEVFTRRYEQGAIILTTTAPWRIGARSSGIRLSPALSSTASSRQEPAPTGLDRGDQVSYL